MARQISRAESWKTAHQIFTQVNFSAFDYNSIKESLIDYTKLYFPEDFNDYIESSEFIAILELFAYVGELLSYRVDMNAHENFITTAQRKESILRLAKMISYKSSRNIPARGLVKITSIQTTENVTDSTGRVITGQKIFWNDSNNSSWKEQFQLVLNRILEQEIGSVDPSERVQVDDVLFELYTLNNIPLGSSSSGVLSYNAAANGENLPMELTPIELTSDGPIERRPEVNAKFSILHANDGLGDGSDTTGFLMFTKQGTLHRQTQTFDGVTPNQTYDITVDNINETDLWVNHVDPDTGEILTLDPAASALPHLVSDDMRYGEWVEVDLANAQNIIFNTNKNRHKYEVEALDNDQVRLIFGDGEFSDIPGGTFDLWFRTSANKDLYIEKSSIVDKTTSIGYIDANGTAQTITLTFSLVNSLQNASASEDIEHIRRVAPSVYYTQDRMVNGKDYNTFMLQDPSILRMRAINRTYAGDSKYISWHDPRENYEDVKIFGDDLALYWVENSPEDGGLMSISSPKTPQEVLTNYIEPLLSSADFFSVLSPLTQLAGFNPGNIRRVFKTANSPYAVTPASGETNETSAILAALISATGTTPIIDLYYSLKYDEWTVGLEPAGSSHPCETETATPPAPPVIPGCTIGSSDSIHMIRVEANFQGSNLSGWDIRWRTRHLTAHSENTRFWNSNNANAIVNFDTFNTVRDIITVLQANTSANGNQLLDYSREFNVIGQELVDQNLPNAGQLDPHRLSVLPVDRNNDGIPDDLLQPVLFDAVYTGTWPIDPSSPQPGDIPTGTAGNPTISEWFIDLSHSIINNKYNVDPNNQKGSDADVTVTVNGTALTFANNELQYTNAEINSIINTQIGIAPHVLPVAGDEVVVTVRSYVYLSREGINEPWIPQADNNTIRTLYLTEDTDVSDEQRYRREVGRSSLNFAWFHFTPRLNLVDPASSNIVDMYIVTVGYYVGMLRWLSNNSDTKPTPPTSLELRTSYKELLNNKMISDTVILHPGQFKILFGSKAAPQLRCKFSVIRPERSSLTDNQVKARIVEIVRSFFDIGDWEFGESFFFTELSAAIHVELGPEIDSVVLVPLYSQNQFGDMFQIQAQENEMFLPDITTADIDIVQSYTPTNIRQNEG